MNVENSPRIVEIIILDIYSELELLVFTVSLANQFSNPLSNMLVSKARTHNLAVLDVNGFQNIEAKGLRGKIGLREIVLSSEEYMKRYAMDYHNIEERLIDKIKNDGHGILFLSVDGLVRGLLVYDGWSKEKPFL